MKLIKHSLLFLTLTCTTFFTLSSCNDDDSNKIETISNKNLSKETINQYSKDYAKVLISIKNETNIETNKELAYLKNKYQINENITNLQSKSSNFYLDEEIKNIINNSEDNKESIIHNLENYKLDQNITPANYLTTSILIETLKLDNEQNSNLLAKASDKSKCQASTIGGLIGGAVAGCGAGAWGGPAGCAIGATFGAIGGALTGWGSNSSC